MKKEARRRRKQNISNALTNHLPLPSIKQPLPKTPPSIPKRAGKDTSAAGGNPPRLCSCLSGTQVGLLGINLRMDANGRDKVPSILPDESGT